MVKIKTRHNSIFSHYARRVWCAECLGNYRVVPIDHNPDFVLDQYRKTVYGFEAEWYFDNDADATLFLLRWGDEVVE